MNKTLILLLFALVQFINTTTLTNSPLDEYGDTVTECVKTATNESPTRHDCYLDTSAKTQAGKDTRCCHIAYVYSGTVGGKDGLTKCVGFDQNEEITKKLTAARVAWEGKNTVTVSSMKYYCLSSYLQGLASLLILAFLL